MPIAYQLFYGQMSTIFMNDNHMHKINALRQGQEISVSFEFNVCTQGEDFS